MITKYEGGVRAEGEEMRIEWRKWRVEGGGERVLQYTKTKVD